ncbi:Piwi-domain-containing protein [Rickenella mellea]|uniref:Piwi-domain-containing protein n=1 Tax=Rickenella mellea TaxID=50990 RepID=A0A4Y7Q830_9AGAM|nr:Piwi-domain-containing protein [Rickenella mellea]
MSDSHNTQGEQWTEVGGAARGRARGRGRGRGRGDFRARGNSSGRGRGQGDASTTSRGESIGRGSPTQTFQRGPGFGDDRGRARGRGDSGPNSPSPSTFGGASTIRGRGAGGPTFQPTGGFETRGRGAFEARGRGGGGGGRPFRGGPAARGRGSATLFSPPNSSTALESRLSASEQDALISGFNALSISDGRPLRPGFGTRGVETKVRANFFALKYPKNATIYDYTIKVTPNLKTDEKGIRKRIFELLEGSRDLAPYLQHIAHDRTQRIVSRMQLPENFVVKVPYYEDGEGGPRPGAKVYEVEVELTAEHSTEDLDRYLAGDPDYLDYKKVERLISAINLVTIQHAARGAMSGKHRYFFKREEALPLGPHLEAWRGYFSSIRPVYKQLMVNVNVCMSAFYVPRTSFSDAIMAFSRQSQGAIPSSFLAKIKVTTTYQGYRARKKVKAIVNKPASQLTFPCDEYKGQISVANFFKRKYGIDLVHGDDLPVIDIGARERNIYVPAELCEIEAGQPFPHRLDEKGTSDMIKYACNPPAWNAGNITEIGLSKLGFPQQVSPMQAFDISVSSEMAVVPSRILPAPTVSYKSGRPNVRDGSWNILGVQFHQGATFDERCAVLVLRDGGYGDFVDAQDQAFKQVVDGFLEKCRKSGMTVRGQPRVDFVSLPRPSPQDPHRKQAIAAVESAIRNRPTTPQLQFLIIFLSNKDNNIYFGLKHLCDVKLGILTVCMLMSKAKESKGQDQYFSNNAMKVNAKLGGVNHLLGNQDTQWLANTMLVGMDVMHPTGKDVRLETPSIVAVVASCDTRFAQYPASIRTQEGRKEMIQQVERLIIERLEEYKKRIGKLPERIVVFRDGVSESQYHEVRSFELPRIKQAFGHFDANYKPKLTITVCGKRHQTRLYPTDANFMDRTGNSPAGTVVDRGITAVFDFDFYLQAHAALQGQARSAHYTVVYDDNAFSADAIQQGTNDLSYLWCRATKSVSLVPPAYWADQACERAKAYLHEILPPAPGSKESKMSVEQIKKRAQEIWGEGVHPRLRGTMFYL